MTEGNFCGCGKLYPLDWLFFLVYVPNLELRLVHKRCRVFRVHWSRRDSRIFLSARDPKTGIMASSSTFEFHPDQHHFPFCPSQLMVVLLFCAVR